MKVQLDKDIHLLFTGGNGQPTFGICVRRQESYEDVEKRGYLRVCPINDITFLKEKDYWKECLDVTPEKFEQLVTTFEQLIKEKTSDTKTTTALYL